MNTSRPDADAMIVQSTDPFNAEPLPDRLIAEHLTPPELFYVRSHGAVPPLDATHRIAIAGVADPRSWSQAELKDRFGSRHVEATLQCAGNRRADLQAVAKTNGDPWGVGAIGHARWTGVSLIDVLREAGVDDATDEFVRFTGADDAIVQGVTAAYGVSIPMAKARDCDVLIAWGMNGEPLSPDHGAPLRIIVPGYAGVRSLKWLTRIEVADAPSDAPIQARDYKLFPATIRSADEADWDAGLTIDALPINAATCAPADGARVAAGPITVRGYAMAYDRGVARVEVSADGGLTWAQATIDRGDGGHWSWVRWVCDVTMVAGEHEIVVRAIDTAGQGQPQSPRQVWNFAGYLSTAWHRISVTAG